MYNGHKRYALFIGRWQPFHKGHKFLIDEAVAKGEHVCVAIRDTEISPQNPYTAEQRAEMIKRVYADKVDVVVIPDIKSINIGRNVGYDVNFVEPPSEIGNISGTNVRAGKDDNVPPEVAEYIKLLRTTLWLTGLPCSGKTTLSKKLKLELDNRGFKTVHLDADDVRHALNADLGFSPEDRKENLRRIAHVAKLFNDNGNFVIASFLSPMNEYRALVKKIIGNFKLVYVKCGLQACEARDVKGMYKRARKGEITDFTGVSAPFEEPPDADIAVDTEHQSEDECVRQILGALGVASMKRRHACLLGKR
ncbi:MAG: adenylyl-sulfate kinase [Candidatus Omnitrophica bacterium]|nr:adenylyl-sulfate kinase [Candidatus Omnitrophota bacterium]MDD5573577.1 adenylyl-sulfate kinase [Candidatus Omnitrophota bacterium]